MSEHGFRIPSLIFAALLPSAVATAVTTQEEASPPPEESGATIDVEPADPEPPEEDLAADYYLSRCAGCHTIGEGFLSGPDLAPSTEWPDEELAKAVERMEKNVGWSSSSSPFSPSP